MKPIRAVLSANHGLLKDDPKLFAVALEQMETPAEDILFLDDWAPYVRVAIESGFQGAVVARDPDTPRTGGLAYVSDLYEVEKLLISRAGGHPG